MAAGRGWRGRRPAASRRMRQPAVILSLRRRRGVGKGGGRAGCAPLAVCASAAGPSHSILSPYSERQQVRQGCRLAQPCRGAPESRAGPARAAADPGAARRTSLRGSCAGPPPRAGCAASCARVRAPRRRAPCRRGDGAGGRGRTCPPNRKRPSGRPAGPAFLADCRHASPPYADAARGRHARGRPPSGRLRPARAPHGPPPASSRRPRHPPRRLDRSPHAAIGGGRVRPPLRGRPSALRAALPGARPFR